MKINDEMRYLWRAVDHEGELLESFVTATKDEAAALTFIKKTSERHLISRDLYRPRRSAAPAEWRAVMG